MRLKAVYQIAGVKVVKGQDKKNGVAMPGDIFEPATEESGEALLRDGAAVRENEDAPKTAAVRGPDVREDQKTPAEKDSELESSPKETPAKGSKNKTGANKAPGLDDLGLGDGSADK